MRLTGIEIRTTSDHVRLIGRVVREANHKVVPWAINEAEFKASSANEMEAEVYFEFPRRYESFISPTADAFAIAMLLPSMAAGEPMEIDFPVSETLLFNLTGIQDIFCTWYPQKFQRVPILVKPRVAETMKKQQRAAAFFSGGVDSFYTLLKRLEPDPLPVPLTHMIFMHGIEQRLANSEGVDRSQQRAEQVAKALGIECIVGETNIRTVFPLHWQRYYVGSALAAIGVALSGGVGYICIPSSDSYHFGWPGGTTPLVDERYSTEQLRIVHDGSEVRRAEKMARMINWNQQLVLDNLRVCIENAGGDFNCGRCYKCVRTAVTLKALGLWEKASLFPDKSMSDWGTVMLDDYTTFAAENLELARSTRIDPDLITELERVVRKRYRYDALGTYMKNSPLAVLLPMYRRLRELTGGSVRAKS